MNRTSITGLACLLAVALTACAGGGEPPAPSGDPASAPLEALKEPANSMSVSPPLSPAPVSAEALAAYRALLAGEPGALDRPPEGWSCTRSPCPRRRSWSMCCWIWTGTAGRSWWCRW
ncbi:MAG: hypothetical protein ACLRNQ_23395 [Flavonifractor plautii]